MTFAEEQEILRLAKRIMAERSKEAGRLRAKKWYAANREAVLDTMARRRAQVKKERLLRL